jgi:hypothetical protein
VFEFAQTSFTTVHAAAQPEWRRTYASLNQRLSNGTRIHTRTRSASSTVCEGIENDVVTAATVYQA